MDDTPREFVSSDGIRWQYTIEHQRHADSIAWRAQVWEGDACRGFLEGRVWTTEPGDPDTICSVALKMALDANYLRDFTQDADEAPAEPAAPAESAAPVEDPGTADDPGVANDPGAADGLAGPDPMPAPA